MGASRLLVIGLLLAFAALPLPAQTDRSQEAAPERRIDLEETRKLREETENNATLAADLSTQLLAVYDEAISFLEASAANEADRKAFERERAGIDQRVQALQAELDRPIPRPDDGIDDDATIEEAEAALARKRSRLAGYRSNLRDAERLSEERTLHRDEISRRLGTLDQIIESVSAKLRETAEQGADPAQRQAAHTRLLAQRQAAESEIEMQRAQLALLDARVALIPLRVDQAQRRMEHAEEVVELLEEATQQLRHRDAGASLRWVKEECRQAAEHSEALAEIAGQTEALAEILWGEEGVVAASERAARDLLITRKHQSDLDRMVQLTRRRFEAFGYGRSIRRWWPENPEGFPGPGDVVNALADLRTRIPEVQQDLIYLEQQRAKARDLRVQTLAAMETDPEASPATRRAARDLLELRQDILDELVRHHGRHANQLVELETISQFFLERLQRLQAFLFERVLWSRSVPRPLIPGPASIGAALGWLFSGESWLTTFRALFASVSERPVLALLILVLLFLLVAMRRRLRGRLGTIAAGMAEPSRDTFSATLETLLHTILLALPVPLALYVGSRVLDGHSSEFVFTLGEALAYGAAIVGLLEFSRQLMSRRGLARVHFHWPEALTRRLHRGLLWPEIVCSVLFLVAIHLTMAGQKINSAVALQAHHHSLGRLAFIVAMVVLGVVLLAIFQRQASAPTRILADPRYRYVYPAITVITLLPAVLAAAGYYVTALLLSHEMLQTLWLVVGLFLLSGLLQRWCTTAKQRLAGAQSLPEGEARSGQDEDSLAPPVPESTQEGDAQVQKLLRFVVIVVAAIGFVNIWSQGLPMLQAMKRVQIWPKVTLLEPVATDDLMTLAGSPAQGDARTTDVASQEVSAGDGDAPVSPATVIDMAAPGAEPETTDSSSLTLWSLTQFLLTFFVTVVLVRNIPGLLALVLQRRRILDAGARIAISTLVRYSITIIGVSAAFGLLGLSWSKVQWLAAALTFGLGFGLQEIVANFVSGLILLMERPVRVGDAVTIGNLQGRVSRIQIRATTITLWDRSEMIVPNKEFITTKLVNWTLSDSRRRIDIPLRVAYGANLQQVKDTLLAVARANPNVQDDPGPMALLVDFGDDAIKFELRVFVDFGCGLVTKDALQMDVDRAFKEQGIEFAIPKLSIQLPEGEKPST